MTNAPTALELAVVNAIVRSGAPGFEELRHQFKEAIVLERRLTGVGFFTRFKVPDGAPLSPAKSPIGKVFAEIEGLVHGAGFILWLDEGKLSKLEGFTFDEHWWPTGNESFVLKAW